MISVGVCSHELRQQAFLAGVLGEGYDVVAINEISDLAKVMEVHSINVFLLDVNVDTGRPGEYQDTYKVLANTGRPVTVLTDERGRAVGVELIRRGASGSCRKPASGYELRAMLRDACAHVQKEHGRQGGCGDRTESAECEFGHPSCDAMIGSSPAMREVYELIQRVARLNTPVLVTGESGTGKELIARAIHNLGARKDQPFIAVSCGAIPETLIESELFGHEKGAFTGSVGTRSGYFEQAGCGTVFLDEIGELSPQTQVKLLRVLQQKEFNRLGNGRVIPLKARVVFATHRNLPEMIAEGKFRLDLYYRINVMTIHSPSLVERPQDIGRLARHFVSHYSEACERFVIGISPAATRLLEAHQWPGNVRELENVIQSAMIRASSEEIQSSDLPDHLRSREMRETGAVDDLPGTGKFETLIRDYKVKLALKAIEDHRGNKTMAARSLDISRAYLHRLIRPGEERPYEAIA